MLSRHDSEQGFTLIELVVGALIAMVVIGVSLNMLLDGVKGSQRAGSNRRAQVEASRVLDELGADLRSAAAPERLDVNEASTRSKLRAGLMSISSNSFAFEDIARATPTQLAFRADAIAEQAGQDHKVECVAWTVQSGTEFNNLVRSVWSNSYSCPGTGPAMTRTVTRLYKTSAVPVFRYNLATPIAGAADPVCEPVLQNSVNSPSQRTRITSVEVNLRGVVRDSKAVQGLDTSGTIDVWSRLTADYQYAIGCAA
jgi:type II secretory pathway pseudopilin PulG